MERPKRSRRRVLREGTTEEYIEEYSESCRWEKWASVARDIDSARDHEVQWRVGDGLMFDYLESYLSNDGCILGIANDEIEAERLMRDADSVFELLIYDESDLLGNIDVGNDSSDLRGLGKALIRAGLGAPLRYDREFFDLIAGHATSHPNLQMRTIAICSMIYTEWPEFAQILRNIIRSDSEERVRNRAQIVLNAYIAAGILVD